ncbi:glycerol-3-phosphate responsive antiterminator [Oceanobacillus bengalensis]|uniref:Glycerol uptake operon antiterminator regulatory protein n=1 Tax=Oceanobacillus bengalensis TaxID=1435466 RepID=A0A494Z6X5_9BACI|nr:glycerol-3-phosphate responsive antiterminator [Oceanobacillus bengalensis]RKQ18245.1 glycerol-3-phosphate responsive antiterminator [Oceanobacillus bengalensis]
MVIQAGVLPAVRKMKDFEKALEDPSETIVLLDTRLSQLKSMVDYANREKKKVLIHFDLIHGLRADSYGMEFLVREIKPEGILSTRGNVIDLAKKNKLLAIQRIFLLDSLALENNLKQIERFRPDCIEVLPGVIPKMIDKIYHQTNIPIIAGGLISSIDDVKGALDAGAQAVTTSNTELWGYKH